MTEESNRKNSEEEPSIFDRSATWFVKKERGLSRSEAEEFINAIENEPSLFDEMKQFEETKRKVQQLPADFVENLFAVDNYRRPRIPYGPMFGAIAAILILCFSLYFWKFRSGVSDTGFFQETVVAQTTAKTHLLPDGSLIRLNMGAELEVVYSESQRRMRLMKGEALFEVTPDDNRRFEVDVDGVEIRAIGTVFNVKRSEKVEVIVTDGIVGIYAPPPYLPDDNRTDPSTPSNSEIFVAVGQRAEVVMDTIGKSTKIGVYDMEVDEVESKLDWRKSLLALNGENLVNMAASFEQKTGYRLVIADPSLEKLRIGGRFPSNDVFGFLRILKTGYDIPWEQVEDGVIILGNDLEAE